MPSTYCRIIPFIAGSALPEQSFNTEIVRLGAQDAAELTLNHPSIEPLHALIDQTGTRPVVRNISERSTLSIQGKVFKRLVLHDETTTINLGKVQLRLTVVTEPKSRYDVPDADGDAPKLTAFEIVQRYQRGHRDFISTRLEGIVGPDGSVLPGINLSYAQLVVPIQRVDLSAACFYKATLGPLEGCNLRGADLRQATLHEADRCSFVGANLTGADFKRSTLFDYKGCDFRHALLRDLRPNRSIGFKDCDLRFADFSGSVLNRARLPHAPLEGATLRGTNLTSADLSQADLRDADLSGATLVQANLTLARLQGADLSGADLSKANLNQAFYDAQTRWPEGFAPENVRLNLARPSRLGRDVVDYSGLDLSGQSFPRFDFSNAYLAGACFDGCDLEQCNFQKAILTGASFQKANLTSCDFAYANLTDADLSGADIKLADLQAAGLDTARFVGAKGFATSIWPMGYDDFDFSKLSKPPRIARAKLHTVEESAADNRPTSVPRPPLGEPDTLHDPLTYKLYPDTPDDDSWGLRLWRKMGDTDVIGLLHLSEHTLRLADKDNSETTRISWERPFAANLAVRLLTDKALELTVTLRHRGQDSKKSLRFKVVLPQARVVAHVPLQQIEAPYIALEGFLAIWPRLNFYSQIHGRSLDGNIDLSNLAP